jgi:hypothetical protein
MHSAPRALTRTAGIIKTELWSYYEGRFPPLDGLRAVAALAIVLFHCGLWVRLFYPRASGA